MAPGRKMDVEVGSMKLGPNLTNFSEDPGDDEREENGEFEAGAGETHGDG